MVIPKLGERMKCMAETSGRRVGVKCGMRENRETRPQFGQKVNTLKEGAQADKGLGQRRAHESLRRKESGMRQEGQWN